MNGQGRFSMAEATEIRATLGALRRVERPEQKALRHALRSRGFYISDWSRPRPGFTVANFDDLVRRGHIRIDP